MDARNASPAREVVITRLLDAPRALVFDAWCKPEHLARWWGPRGWTSSSFEVDCRPGGAFNLRMHGPDGEDQWVRSTFREVVALERIVFTSFVGDSAEELRTTVTFADQGGKTLLTVRQAIPADPEMGRGQNEGWNETIDRLAELLAKA